jgi:hypothetical protein
VFAALFEQTPHSLPDADARGVFTAARRTPFTTLRFGRNTASFGMARGPRKRLVAGGRVSLPFAAAAH